MSKPPTLEEIVRYKKVPQQWIRQRCSHEHLREIAQKIVSWDNIASFLNLEPSDEQIIRRENQFDYAKQKEAMLLTWDRKFGSTGKATYEALMKAFVKIGNTALAESVCDILKASPPVTSSATAVTPPNVLNSTPPQPQPIASKLPPEEPSPQPQQGLEVLTTPTTQQAPHRVAADSDPATLSLQTDFNHKSDATLTGLDDDQLKAAFQPFPSTYWEINHAQLNGMGTVLAILDTGINTPHLAFNVMGKIVDKCNFLANPPNDDVTDSDGHGTHCAGIASGIPYGPIGLAFNVPGGVAPASQLIIHRVGDQRNGFNPQAVVAALDRLIQLKKNNLATVDVVSMSFGSTSYALCVEMEDKILELTKMGTICVAAAGNYGATRQETICYPARFDNVICVGAHKSTGKPASFTSAGGEIDFLGPGKDIWGPSHQDSAALACASGTSCATPAVAGLICLLIQRAKKLPLTAVIAGKHASDYICKVAIMRRLLKKISRSHGATYDGESGFGSLDPRELFEMDDNEFHKLLSKF